jgi:hypothetical protein
MKYKYVAALLCFINLYIIGMESNPTQKILMQVVTE